MVNFTWSSQYIGIHWGNYGFDGRCSFVMPVLVFMLFVTYCMFSLVSLTIAGIQKMHRSPGKVLEFFGSKGVGTVQTKLTLAIT
jgi:hypothetical protein